MRTSRRLKRMLMLTGEERGMAFIIALFAVVVLMLMGSLFLTLSVTESTVASNDVNHAKAFYIAEGGLEHAKRTMKMSTARSHNVFLTGTNPGPYPFGDTPGAGNSLGGGNYIVRIYDNNDDPNPNNDTDLTVFIESTGIYRNTQRQIVSLVQIPLVPTPEGATEVSHPGAPGLRATEVELRVGSSIDGRDWMPPADLSACADVANCGTLTTDPAITGVSSNATSPKTEIEVAAPATLDGSPSSNIDTSLTPAPWDNLIDQVLLANATRTLTIPDEVITGNYTWGTPDAPEITVISNPNIYFNNATINGAGILIIEQNAEIEFEQAVVNWQGVIINRGRGIDDPLLLPKPGFANEIEVGNNAASALRLFGGLIAGSSATNPQAEVEFENSKTFVKYSSWALDMVRGSLPTTVVSWREVPM